MFFNNFRRWTMVPAHPGPGSAAEVEASQGLVLARGVFPLRKEFGHMRKIRDTQFGTPDLLWLGPQGAADRGRLRRFTAAPCPFGKHIVAHR